MFLAQGVLGRVVQRAQQGLLPPGPGTHTLAGSALMLPTLQVAVCTLFLIPWTLLGDRYGPRLPYTGGLLVWTLGVLAGSWAGSTEFLLASYALQAAGVAAVIPAALTVITSAQPRPGGFLTGVVVAFPALLQLPGSLIADLLTRSTDWRAALLLVSGAAVPPLLLGWFAIPSGPATTGPDDDPPPERPAGRGRAVIQALLLGAALAGVRIHLELSFAAHHGAILLGDSTGYARAHSGLVDFPFAAGLAVGFIAGAALPGGHRKTVLAWVIAAPGPVMASVPLLPSGIAWARPGSASDCPGSWSRCCASRPRTGPSGPPPCSRLPRTSATGWESGCPWRWSSCWATPSHRRRGSTCSWAASWSCWPRGSSWR